MTIQRKAEKAGSLAKMLFLFSLLVTLIWWWVGVWLFVGGALMALSARLLERAVLPVVAQE